MAPQIIFGTASFGMPLTQFQDAEAVQNLLRSLQDFGIIRLDSGARYPPLSPGQAEELIGEAKEVSGKFSVDTKVYTDTRTDGSGDLTIEAIEKSVKGSLKRLQRPGGVSVLHIHRADPTTPLEEQIRGFNEQISKGHCKEWGVSNVPPAMLEKILELCEKHGWQKPSCYQGLYSLITRGMETKLLPLLRAHGIKYNAFQPLAAGFLTGKFLNNEHAGTRFGDNHPLGEAVRKVFGSEDLLNAMKKFNAEVKAQGLVPVEVAIRWIMYHSPLQDDDGVIIGASKKEQVDDTLGHIQRGPLPDSILALVEELWAALKETRGHII